MSRPIEDGNGSYRLVIFDVHSWLQDTSLSLVYYKQAQPMAGLSVQYLEYWLRSLTIFHYLSLHVINYLLITAWRLSSLERLVATIRWKEQASSRSRRHVFHPNKFLCSRVTGQSTSGSAHMWLPFSVSSRTYGTQPTVIAYVADVVIHRQYRQVSACWNVTDCTTIYAEIVLGHLKFRQSLPQCFYWFYVQVIGGLVQYQVVRTTRSNENR